MDKRPRYSSVQIDLKVTFTAKEVQAITGSGVDPLQSWSKRGYLTALEHDVGSAHKRRYSLINLFEVQFLIYAVDRGVELQVARQALDNVLSRARKILAARALGISPDAERYWIIDPKITFNPVVAEITEGGVMTAVDGKALDLDDMAPVAMLVAIDRIIGRVIDRAAEIKAE